jgi:hypothetical protein
MIEVIINWTLITGLYHDYPFSNYYPIGPISAYLYSLCWLTNCNSVVHYSKELSPGLRYLFSHMGFYSHHIYSWWSILPLPSNTKGKNTSHKLRQEKINRIELNTNLIAVTVFLKTGWLFASAFSPQQVHRGSYKLFLERINIAGLS